MEWLNYGILIGVGIITGFINTVSGSGSLLTLPVLMFLGLPPNMANGTNRIGILFQSIVGVASFKQQKVLELRTGLWLCLPIIIGSILGAQIAVSIDDLIMDKIIAGLLLGMFLFVAAQPGLWIKEKAQEKKKASFTFNMVLFFVLGLYGGFIQVGIGFFLLAGLALSAGYGLMKANALKVFLILAYTPFALYIYIQNEQVHWPYGLLLAGGSMLGAWIASRIVVRRGAQFIRYFVLITLLASALKLLGLF